VLEPMTQRFVRKNIGGTPKLSERLQIVLISHML
jgi:hypothetical protein